MLIRLRSRAPRTSTEYIKSLSPIVLGSSIIFRELSKDRSQIPNSGVMLNQMVSIFEFRIRIPLLQFRGTSILNRGILRIGTRLLR